MNYDEHDFGDGYSNDYQRAAAYQLIERPLKDERWFAASLHRAGMHVVMCRALRYCNVTSAVLGEDITVAAGYANLAEAEAYLGEQNANDSDGDFGFYLFAPPAPRAAVPATRTDDEDEPLPF